MNDCIELLEQKEKSYDTVYQLSLLYRYYDLYEKEKGLFDEAVHLGHDSQYMMERLQWHALSMCAHCVPRKKYNAERTEIPRQETMDQLCFILSGNTLFVQI